jgi:hypothetical protein
MEPKKLTLTQIHAMFKNGQTWLATNTWLPSANGPRHVAQIFTKQIKWDRPESKTSWMDMPKASDVIEARDGLLSFHIRRPGTTERLGTLTLTRVDCEYCKSIGVLTGVHHCPIHYHVVAVSHPSQPSVASINQPA